MTSQSIYAVPLPDGIYCGTWKGVYVTIAVQGDVTTFKVDTEVYRKRFPCIVFVENKKATIDSGNPVISQIAQWETKAAKWDALNEKIGKYYLEPGEEGYDKMNDENGLLGIGEDAARAFGYF